MKTPSDVMGIYRMGTHMHNLPQPPEQSSTPTPGAKTLSVSAIKKGTVIDHIPPGQAIRIIQLLCLTEQDYSVMVGMNLRSAQRRRKDLIKIEQHLLDDGDIDRITAFAPGATINLIADFKVVKKISAHLP